MELSVSRSARPGGVVRSAPLGQNSHESTTACFCLTLSNLHLSRNENMAATRTQNKIKWKNLKYNKRPDPKSQKACCWQHVPAIHFYVRRLLWITPVHFRCSRILHARTDKGKAHWLSRECRSSLVSHAHRLHIMMSWRQWLDTIRRFRLSADSGMALRGPSAWLQSGFSRRILCRRDAIRPLKFVTMSQRWLRCVGERNRKWQKPNLGGGAVTHRRLAATEIVRGGLDLNGFHTSTPSSAERALSALSGAPFPSDQVIITVRSDCRVLQKYDSFIGFPSECAVA